MGSDVESAKAFIERVQDECVDAQLATHAREPRSEAEFEKRVSLAMQVWERMQQERDAAIRHQALIDAMRAVDTEMARSGYAGIACAAIGKLLEKTGGSDGK